MLPRKKKRHSSVDPYIADYERATQVINIILDNRGVEIEEDQKLILLGTIDRYKFHMENSYQAQKLYRWLSHGLAMVTPALGATVTTISLVQGQSLILASLGFLVAITSAFNSVYKASYSFEKCANLLIRLNDWVIDLEIGLIDGLENSQTFPKQGLNEFIRRKDQELSEIGQEHSSIVMPYMPGAKK